ncbi:MAG: 30S ribosomal protein S4e [Candidatus Thermoplasmatota archaeon]|nr:30S ribosomal protein S4e [Euryarchaeota archaeon]MBU4031934.1 30S ribosomal protein S4e [Candidatus Thermoplasmatota archaeon]MBU4072476.1 30S ribosomal protein S4e [Candidatus Thermoplasmatota archaeon]MBU4144174.1 30S ribosomal protein S4e [Candidatus Thermoplasmatota archaeon]MBU4592808.1 30S ribosomal protein S4e [Candidatus Thermoplasmatota archaeon]
MSKHMKRLTAPISWPVRRKTAVWVTKPTPGAHPIHRSMPLLVLIRDMAKYCDTAREARRIIGQRKIYVDGKVATNYKMPVGVMDVISVPDNKDHFRLLLDRLGHFRMMRISPEEAKWKLVRIENKTTIRNGKIQLNLHDGRNIVLDKNARKTGDTLKISIPDQKILGAHEFKEGNVAYLTGGAHIGELGTVQNVEITRSSASNIVKFKDGFSTVKDYVFMVGEATSEISLPEVSAL